MGGWSEGERMKRGRAGEERVYLWHLFRQYDAERMLLDLQVG